MMFQFPPTAEEFEKAVLENAAYFTTCLFSGRGQYGREEHKTLAEARARAAQRTDSQGRRAMIYAVTADGRDAMVT